MTVAFIGHRRIEYSVKLESELKAVILNFIVNENADTFLFGSKSEFNSLCSKVVSELQTEHKQIKKVYVRAEYEYIDKDYTDYLLESYDDTYFPKQVEGAGRLSYIKRNKEMIDSCDVLITYFNDSYQPCTAKHKTNSGTKIAVEYAKSKHTRIVNLLALSDSKQI